ncbi:hypothetical protein CWE24_02650 [Pseudidiomarina donghaiensis]|uniref:Uncharacterized protein n=1 Tax=Pseudidiomarina donghaiensis TaxID=519452 RepID=A0A432XL56_9GAMM|nr:hypothetical protein CWE24_02650 [Pseudidiomarina donghaiensis]
MIRKQKSVARRFTPGRGEATVILEFKGNVQQSRRCAPPGLHRCSIRQSRRCAPPGVERRATG